MSRIISVREGKDGGELLFSDIARLRGSVPLWGSLTLGA